MNAIQLTHVTKIYQRYNRRRQFATLKSALLSGSLIRDLRPDDTFAAVRDVTFTVPAGRTLGVIGRNGSGKSTLLKLVAGITKPSAGHLTVRGRISALIELGAGFHPEISGRENVFINGIMLGLSKKEIARRFDEIVEFAELREFIDAPVKTYSSGMYMRLGFAVAIHVDPEVLLVDEVLAVGEEGRGRPSPPVSVRVPIPGLEHARLSGFYDVRLVFRQIDLLTLFEGVRDPAVGDSALQDWKIETGCDTFEGACDIRLFNATLDRDGRRYTGFVPSEAVCGKQPVGSRQTVTLLVTTARVVGGVLYATAFTGRSEVDFRCQGQTVHAVAVISGRLE